MTELIKLLEANGAFKSDLIQDLLFPTRQSSCSTTASHPSLQPQPTDVNLNLSLSSTQSTNGLSTSASTADNCNLSGNTTFASTGINLNENTATLGANIDNKNTTNVSVETAGHMGPNANLNAGLVRAEGDDVLAKIERVGAWSTEADPNANAVTVTDASRILSEVQESLSEGRQLLVDQVTRAIIEAHMTTTANTQANVAEANNRLQSDVNPTSINANDLWQNFLSALLPEITKVIKFCTKLPGFPEVAQEDKICLVKQGCFEVMVTRFCLLVDHVSEEMFDPTLVMKASRQIVQDTPMGEFFDQFFTVAGLFNPLALTDEEIGLFTATLILCPDREGLINRGTVHKIQQLFLQSLYLLIRRSHTDADQTICTLISLVPVLRKINEQHLKCLGMMKIKSPTEFEQRFPPLHKELFDST